MATAVVMSPLTLPGVDAPLTVDDMKAACLTYNTLPYIKSQPRIANEHIKALLNVINRHGMGDSFGIHIAHRHDTIPDGSVRLESKLGTFSGTWTKAIPIPNLDLNDIHPTVYKLTGDQLVPFEFAVGPSPVSTSAVRAEFIQDIADYIVKHGLTELVALQLGIFVDGGQPLEPTAEIEFDGIGTVVLPVSIVKPGEKVPTGWNVRLEATEGDKPPPGQTWAPMVNTSHKVFNNKPANVTPEELMDELRVQGVINA